MKNTSWEYVSWIDSLVIIAELAGKNTINFLFPEHSSGFFPESNFHINYMDQHLQLSGDF